MIYQYSSVKEVIGNVIRNTRLQDTSFILDMPEWIGEAMSFMRTRMQLVDKFEDTTIDFHAGKLPAGLVSIDCVQYKGCRLNRMMNSHYQNSRIKEAVVPTIFQTSIIANTVSEPGETVIYPGIMNEYIFKTEWQYLPYSKDTFHTENGYIKTSFCDGTVRIHYRSIPLDDEGFPMIPDNANYKQALYWHCRAMMIGAGFQDPVFNHEYCDGKFELYAIRAMGQIRYPTPDTQERNIPTISRFLPDNYLTFFNTSINQ